MAFVRNAGWVVPAVIALVGAGAGLSTPKPATLDGKVVQDKKAVARQVVSLYQHHGKKSAEVAKIKTDARGRFVFRVSRAGKYSVGVGVVVEKQDVPKAKWGETSGFAGMAWNKPCRPAAPGLDNILNVPASKKTTGEFVGFIISVTTKAFAVQLGAHITHDLAFTCR